MMYLFKKMKHIFLGILLFNTLLFATESSVFLTSQHIYNTMQRSSYEHKRFVDETSGTYNVDCSSFIGFIIEKVSPKANAILPIDAPHKRALAKNFYEFLQGLSASEVKDGWMGIARMDELEKGDIIAWKYDPSLHKTDTGHVVMVYEKPILEADGRYKIRVMDSSKGKHANDSRDETSTGIGIGTMWFRVDEHGVPNGLYWSDKSKKISEHAIAMGRVVTP